MGQITHVSWYVLRFVSIALLMLRHTKCQRSNSDVILSVMSSRITRVSIVCSTVWSAADKRTHQSSASPHKRPVRRKMVPFGDVIMRIGRLIIGIHRNVSYKDVGSRSRYLSQGEAIASHIIMWDAITYPCLRYLLSGKFSYNENGPMHN